MIEGDKDFYISCVGKWWKWESHPPHWYNTEIDSKIWVPKSREISKLEFLLRTGWDLDNTMKAIVPHD